MAAVWMLLVDTTYLPELLTGVVAAAIAATGTELVREQRLAQIHVRARWLVKLWRPVIRVPVDIAILTTTVVRQLIRRDASVGEFRALRFDPGKSHDPADNTRRALIEGTGSFAPNTYVVGVDLDRKLVLAHQLVKSKQARKAIDPLELG